VVIPEGPINRRWARSIGPYGFAEGNAFHAMASSWGMYSIAAVKR